jgi:hypothetical protein
MTAEEKKARRSEINKWIWVLVVDIGIVAGYLITEGVNPIYTNFLILVHINRWFLIIASLGIVALFMFLNLIIEKIGVESMSDDTSTGQDKVRGLIQALLKVKVGRKRWTTRYYSVVQLGVMAFIGLVMGHWSLLAVYGLAWFLGLLVTAAAAHAYDKAPDEWKSADTTGDGVPDDEAELLRKAEMNPVSLAFENAREKRAEEKRKKNESTESLVDTLFKDDLT